MRNGLDKVAAESLSENAKFVEVNEKLKLDQIPVRILYSVNLHSVKKFSGIHSWSLAKCKRNLCGHDGVWGSVFVLMVDDGKLGKQGVSR